MENKVVQLRKSITIEGFEDMEWLFQEPTAEIVSRHLNNIILTYGPEVLRETLKMFDLNNSTKKESEEIPF